MQRRERQRTGQPRPISEFLVGAHALLQCDALITFDAAFYRDWFKGLKLIVPKG
jgi:predicted nucleic acid-binding protein